MLWQVHMEEDEILLEFRNGENHIIVSIDEDGPGYAIREGNAFHPGKYELKGDQFASAIKEILAAYSRS